MAEIKPSYDNNRTQLGEQLPLSAPFSVTLSTSELCNFKCSYCFRSSPKGSNWGFAASEEIINRDIFNLATEQLSEFDGKVKVVSLSGHGEPLCNPELEDMASVLRQKVIAEKIEMHTNASLLTSSRSLKIVQAGFTRIVISLQGLSAEDYLRVCGAKINWDEFYGNIKILYNSKPHDLKVHIKISDAAITQGDEDKFYNLFDGISDSLYVEKAVPLWKGMGSQRGLNTNKYGEQTGEINYCPLVFYTLLISPRGDIYPCTRLPAPDRLGNVRDVSLLQAWNSPKRTGFLREHLVHSRHHHLPCKDCYIPINSITSSMDNIDPFKDDIIKRL